MTAKARSTARSEPSIRTHLSPGQYGGFSSIRRASSSHPPTATSQSSLRPRIQTEAPEEKASRIPFPLGRSSIAALCRSIPSMERVILRSTSSLDCWKLRFLAALLLATAVAALRAAEEEAAEAGAGAAGSGSFVRRAYTSDGSTDHTAPLSWSRTK